MQNAVHSVLHCHDELALAECIASACHGTSQGALKRHFKALDKVVHGHSKLAYVERIASALHALAPSTLMLPI